MRCKYSTHLHSSRYSLNVYDFLLKRGYEFFDMSNLHPTKTIVHNCLALHSVKHGALIHQITKGEIRR